MEYNHSIELPNSKTKINFRPWTIADELEYSANEDIMVFLKKLVLNSDILNNIDNAEIYWLIKEIRSISKMSNIDFTWKCSNNNCGTAKQDLPSYFDVNADVKFMQKEIDSIVIDENLTYYFRNLTFYETIEFNKKIESEEKLSITKLSLMKIVDTIKTIIFKDEIFENLTYDEKYDFVTKRPNGELKILLDSFTKTQNIVTLTKECTCPVCGTKKEVMAGLDFFHL